jgi:sortase A
MRPSVLGPPAVARRRVAGIPLRRLVRDLSLVLVISGVVLLIDAAVSFIWREPVTAVVGFVQRSNLDKSLLAYQTAPLTGPERHALSRISSPHQRIAYLARHEESQAAVGQAIGQISMPAISVGYDFVEGNDAASLKKGPGHYPATAFPGLGHTVAIAGHRTTYLAPFRHIDELKPGDPVYLTMPYARFTYIVQYQLIVPPTALWVTRDVGYERLVLSAGDPLYSGDQRVVVFARLRSETPLGPAGHA